jgi:catechol 2,3-dioxygenase-like lactoylglutathione lyase family enzyme
MHLDHVNVRCSDLQATAAFFESVVGLRSGPRPPFSMPGMWLYDETDRAVVHLLVAAAPLGDAGAVDHVAFRYDDLAPQLQHLAELGYPCAPVIVPGTSIHQCFVIGPDGLQIEFQGELRTDLR